MKTLFLKSALSWRYRHRGNSGFTLVEITLAMGIVAGGLLTLLSLIPAGLDNLRLSMNDTAESRIVEELTSKLQSSDWDDTHNLADFNSSTTTPLYFDTQGNEKAQATDFGAVYAVQMEVDTLGLNLPGSSVANNHLRQVRIRITDRPASATDRFTDRHKHRLITVLVTRMSANKTTTLAKS